MKGFPDKKTVGRVREAYPTGTRVELVKMDDAQAPPMGTHGTVRGVDDAGDLLMSWDSGGSLKVVYGEDIVKKLDAVRVTCYGKEEVWDSREEAVDFYFQAMAGCDPDSHEHLRYETIFTQLVAGLTEATDEGV